MKKFILILILCPLLLMADSLFLRENLERATPGDYIVTLQNRNFTILLVKNKDPQTITIEEVTVPDETKGSNTDWKQWVEMHAPGHTSWVLYTIDIPSGKLTSYYNYFYDTWYDTLNANIFLSKLLNLELHKVPLGERKKIGKSAGGGLWQPPLAVDGKQIFRVPFDAYSTQWPKDGSELSEKKVLIYLPEESSKYPSYFPYWLEVKGTIGKAQVRIVDSGRQLTSPKKVK